MAHGETLRDAMSDLEYKLSSNEDKAYHINRIAKQGYMNVANMPPARATHLTSPQ